MSRWNFSLAATQAKGFFGLGAGWLSILLLLAGCAGTTTLPEPTEGPAAEARPAVDPAAQEAFQAALRRMESGQLEEAVKGFQRLTLTHPQYRGPWLNLGIALSRKGETEAAMKLFRDITGQHPDWAVAHHELAILQRRAGQFIEARRSYEAAIAAQPDFALAYRNLGLLCDLYLHDINCALSKYEKYQTLLGSEDKEVTLWIADLKRRIAGSQ
ncbi:MAG: hypothetical protein Kow006_26890 [Gammaproteobacteria bacterium]